ncbi:MAG: hypothetical protein C0616_11535 [Desulfuromonas sp.]|nr:MAG: hypothetical protein C0616_11535 [Desulfuromonas sp.]
MNRISLPLIILCGLLLSPTLGAAHGVGHQQQEPDPIVPQAESAPATDLEADCQLLLTELRETNRSLHRQLREAKRDIALTKAEADKPGWPEVAGGIGIIFGLFGIFALIKRGRD